MNNEREADAPGDQLQKSRFTALKLFEIVLEILCALDLTFELILQCVEVRFECVEIVVRHLLMIATRQMNTLILPIFLSILQSD